MTVEYSIENIKGEIEFECLLIVKGKRNKIKELRPFDVLEYRHKTKINHIDTFIKNLNDLPFKRIYLN